MIRMSALIWSIWVAALTTAVFCSGTRDALASCLEDNRQINDSDKSIVRLRGYLCTIGNQPSSPQVRVEFHRLSDGTMSELMGNAASGLLKRVLGSPKVIHNEIAQVYTTLVQRFGTLTRISKDDRSYELRVETPGKINNSGRLSLQRQHSDQFRTLLDPEGDESTDFPAIDEILSLKQKIVPQNLHSFYSIHCLDGDDADPPDRPRCKKVDRSVSSAMFWRSLTSDDIQNYSTNVVKYNTLLRRAKKDPLLVKVPDDLQLFQYLSNGQLPENFAFLIGVPAAEGCGDDIGVMGWNFNYSSRVVLFEAISIRNMSSQDITLNGLMGTVSSDTDLRPIASQSRNSVESARNIDLNVILQPNQSILFFTRIKLVPDYYALNSFIYPETAKSVFNQIGAHGYSGNTGDFVFPHLEEFAYGREYMIDGFMADNQQVSFSGKVANFLNLTVASESGSCPYLLANVNGSWETFGKVLHRSNSQKLEAEQTITYPGFVNLFRLEEREREFAHIDAASVEYVLKDGSMIEVRSTDPRLFVRDQRYLDLSWGDSFDLFFSEPKDIDLQDVTETRLMLTGYYERDGNIAFMENGGR
jgi:hypothetical protein